MAQWAEHDIVTGSKAKFTASCLFFPEFCQSDGLFLSKQVVLGHIYKCKASNQSRFTKFSLPQLSPETRLLDVLNPVCVCLSVSCEGNIVVQVCLTSGVEQAFTAYANLPLLTWIRVDLFIQASEVLKLFHSDLSIKWARAKGFSSWLLFFLHHTRGQFPYYLLMHCDLSMVSMVQNLCPSFFSIYFFMISSLVL